MAESQRLYRIFPFKRATLYWHKIAFGKKSLRVSIIVPNYNHEKYLQQRLDSIYSQTYSNYEVILLDDCSTDASRDILLHYNEKYPENTKIIFNDINTGKPFLQWLRGIEAAEGDLIWIAESDDYCDADFLEKLLPSFEDEAVSLAYCSTDFVQNGKKIWDLNSYLIGFSLPFTDSFMITAHQFVRKVMFCKNPIANGSSALFKKPVSIPEDLKNTITDMKLCGDWLLYLHIIKGGVVSFVHDTKDYYRIHPQSTSLRVQKTFGYFEEQVQVLSYIAENYAIETVHIDRKYRDLLEEYLVSYAVEERKKFDTLFDRDALLKTMQNRKPNLGMCCFAFTVGGGEFVPIHLANALRGLGYPVTFLDFDLEERNPMVRAALSPDVPVVYAPLGRDFNLLMAQLGLDVLHSHHGSVDNSVGILKKGQNYEHLVTFHGFYESINDNTRARDLLHNLQKNNTYFVYTADKNLPLARQAGIDVDSLEKVPNGLPSAPVGNVSRGSLGLSDDDFVLCLVSRALPTKGWEEAVEIIVMVNEKSSRPVHLLLIGEGEMYDKLKDCRSPYIHCLGNQFALQDFYTISDLGFFPSRYPGESFPLVNIECLLSGTPIIASDIGEVANQLTTENGNVAGALFQLKDGQIPVAEVASLINLFVSDTLMYEKAKKTAKKRSSTFDITSVMQNYIKIYTSIVARKSVTSGQKG